VLSDLRAGRLKVLVATDLASRGLDVTGVSHIVNYDIPTDPAVYVHRIGRTARMGNSGHALTFVTPEQGRELTDIEMLIDQELTRVDTPGAARASTESAGSSVTVVKRPVDATAQRVAAGADAATSTPARSRPRRTLGSRFPRSRRRR
jgi:superfamily II DNA/RNA helicase